VRIVLKILLTIAVVAFLAVSVSLGWFYFHSGDLPHSAELARFLPDTAATVSDECSGTEVRALPSASFGENLQNAMRAAEGPGDEVFARQVALSLFCNSRTDMLKSIYWNPRHQSSFGGGSPRRNC
jgi:hypothetical protein